MNPPAMPQHGEEARGGPETEGNAPEVTIAITVYDRRQYILGAVRSALDQTVPARVIVVEDCGPDPGLRAFVLAEFGGRIEYVRNARRRGLFGNWNACLEACRTPWLSILHDDDSLKPWFVESVLGWKRQHPGRGIYFGTFEVVNEAGVMVEYPQHAVQGDCEPIDLRALAADNTLGFPGHILDVQLARELGGFRETSQFCGDWEMWFKLVAARGGMRGARPVTCVRFYDDERRGTSKVVRSGRCFGLTIVQRRRNRALLQRLGHDFGWSKAQIRSAGGPFPRLLLSHAWGYAPRWARYNIALFRMGDCRGWAAAGLRLFARVFGPAGVVLLSRGYRRAQERGWVRGWGGGGA